MRLWTYISGLLIALVVMASVVAFTSHSDDPLNAPVASVGDAPGFKFMVLINKQEDISFEEYEEYFFETHLPYVLAIPGLRAYKVNLRHREDEDAPFDGISEFWFDDRAAFEHAMASPETEATLADAANFLLPPQILLVDERVVRTWDE